jgi:RNA polymerase sigma factor for flagellar operon FliA
MSLPDFQRLLGELRGLDLGSLQSWSAQNRQESEASIGGPNHAEADPFAMCLRSELKSHLVQAMTGLGERERQVLALYYAEELTMKEVGAMLGIGESRVSQIHSSAVTRLRARLQAVIGADTPA